MNSVLFAIIVIIIISIWVSAIGWDKIYSNAQKDADSLVEIFKNIFNNSNSFNNKLNRRHHALNKAKPFLKPYKDPMGELCLANENCKVNLVIEEKNNFTPLIDCIKIKKIICISKTIKRNNTRSILTATASRDYEAFYNVPFDDVTDNIFDVICENFTYTTDYNNIYSALSTGMLDVKESVVVVPTRNNKTQCVYDKVTNTQIRTNNLLNINTASEAELSALPGVNIVTAKKILKYIEKNGGFKSVNEFIEKMKIKDVFADQIRNIICTNIEDTNNQMVNNEKNNLELSDNSVNDYIPHTENERIIDL